MSRASEILGKIYEAGDLRIVHNRLLGAHFVVRGPHQTPIGGPHPSKEAAQKWLRDQRTARDKPVTSRVTLLQPQGYGKAVR